MYLKKLHLKGFKTFAEQTEIAFHPGINTVVGPNGCGKSNLVDAVRWTLGEANIRHLRGSKSEDIIFHGTDQKKAQSMASVEMIIDNGDRALPIEYSELVISRKAFRTGESEFNLNQSRVRLKDITQLLAGTGLGKKGYSIIGQGELEQVLNGQPLERRLILEEASGVIKYRQQRDEVKVRIENTVNNMLRINDLLQEIDQRKGELQLKAEKALQFQTLNQELQTIEENLLHHELYQLNSLLSQVRSQLEEKESRKIKLQQELAAEAAQYEEQEAALNQLGLDIRQLQDEKQTHDDQLALLHTELKLGEERLKNSRERQQQARSDQEKYAQRLADFQQDLEEKKQDWELEKELLQQKELELRRLETEQLEMQTLLEENDREFSRQKTLLFTAMQKAAEVKNYRSDNDGQIKTVQHRTERLDDKLADTMKQISHLQAALADQQSVQQEILQQQKQIKSQLAGQEGCYEEQAQRQQQLQIEYNRHQEEQMRLNSRLQIIADLDRNMTGYSPIAKQLIQAGLRQELDGIMGIMGEMIRVPAGMETAIDVAVGKGLENIVVDTEAHAHQAIAWLKEKKQGRLTFLPLDILRTQTVPPQVLKALMSMPGVLGLGSRLVSCEAPGVKALDYLLGRVLIVDTIYQAGKVFRNLKYPLRLVTLDGEVINVSGAISGGVKADRQQNSPLQRRAEQARLTAALEKNRQILDHNRAQYAEAEKQLQVMGQEVAALKSKQLEIEYKAEMAVKEYGRLQEELKTKQGEAVLFNQELTLMAKEREELERRGQILSRDEMALDQQSHQLNQALEVHKEKQETMQREYEIRKERSRSFQEQVAMKHKELAGMEANIRQFNQIRESYRKSEQETQELDLKLKTEIAAEESKRETLLQELEQKEQTALKIKEELDRHLSTESRLKQELLKRQQNMQPIKNQLTAEEEAYRRLENTYIRKETEGQALQEKWHELFHRPPLQEQRTDLTHGQQSSMKARRTFLKSQIEQMGPVDMEAIEEYERVFQRHTFLNTQYQDLEEANTSLHKLLLETEKMMDKDYKAFFLLANQSFQQTCAEIFEGGEAMLKHEENKPGLEAGLHLEVKLPGKRSQAINLLSGGEKALTCIAFIFALMRLRPVPFCLLDEIDAALDEHNLRRFTRFITNMAQHTQFIVITHRQATIEIGDHIYGVTMPEKGMSSVLTLRLDDNHNLAV